MPTEEGVENKKPPVCLFSWGSFCYKGVVHRIDQKFILFLPDGTPVREELSVSFRSVMTKEEYAKCWELKHAENMDCQKR